MEAEEYLLQQLEERKLFNCNTDDCYQVLAEIMQAFAKSCCEQQRISCDENAKIYRNAPRDSSIDFKFYGGNDEDYTIHSPSILETPLTV